MATERKTTTKASKKPAAAASAPLAASSTALSTVQVNSRNSLQKRKAVVGTVVSDKMQKTIVVKVDRRVRHSFYKKYIVRSRRFKAHDEQNTAKIGDLVSLVESRPMSREKRWVLQSIIRKAEQALEANV